MSAEVNSNMKPCYVVLTRLSNEFIERLTGKKQNEQVLSDSHIQPDQIKEEPIDDLYNYQENVNYEVFNEEAMTWQYLTDVKIETDSTTSVKIEEPDDYDNSMLNPQYTSCMVRGSDTTEYKCDLCPSEFDNYELFIVHKALSHKNNKPYACELCDKRFTLKIHLNIHSTEHANDFYSRRASTLPTDIQSSSRTNLPHNNNNRNSITFLQGSGTKSLQNKKQCGKKNMSISTQYCASNSNMLLLNDRNRQPFKCPNCLFASASEKKFIDHHKYCNKQFKCHLCDKPFLTQAAVNAHMRFHSKKKGQIIQHIKKLNTKVKSQNDIIVIKPATLLANKCKECNRHFISQRNLNIHLKLHKKQLMCKICNKQYFSEKAFEKHLLTHGYKK